jgi:hypothetical protein
MKGRALDLLSVAIHHDPGVEAVRYKVVFKLVERLQFKLVEPIRDILQRRVNLVVLIRMNPPAQALPRVFAGGHLDIDVVDEPPAVGIHVIDSAVSAVRSANELHVVLAKPFCHRRATECVIVLGIEEKAEEPNIIIDNSASYDHEWLPFA